MTNPRTLGVVTKDGNEVEWTTEGWKSKDWESAAEFLNAAGIGSDINPIVPGEYDRILNLAATKLNADSYVSSVEKSTQPSGTCY